MMLLLRIQRAQNQLQAHHRWLWAFANQNWISSASTFDASKSRTFSSANTAHAQSTEQAKKRTKRRPAFQQRHTTKPHRTDQHRHGTKRAILESSPQNDAILQAIDAYDFKQVVALYNSLPEKKPCTPEIVARLAQCVSRCLRLEDFKHGVSRSKEDIDAIVAFATRLATDIKKRRLPPSLHAHTHLLAVFRESGTYDAGIEFWEWLHDEDEQHVNPLVYAAAIDLLAASGYPLSELEQLFQDALDTTPGNFSAYHLSHTAILRDRESEFKVPGIPMALLLSITKARLMNGEARKAYLGLDTGLRLHPSTLGPRFFASFQDERPATEFFTVFAIASRAGIQIPESLFKGHIIRLRELIDLRSVPIHFSIIRAMLAAVQLHTGSNRTIQQITVNEIAIALINIVRLPGFSSLESNRRQSIVDRILAANRELLSMIARLGTRPGTAFYNAMISAIGSIAGYKPIISMTLADMKALGVEESDVTRRSLLLAGGLLSDGELVRTSWQSILASSAQSNTSPNGLDWRALITSAGKAHDLDFAKEQFEMSKTKMPFPLRKNLEEVFQATIRKNLGSQQDSRHSASGITEKFFEQVDSLLQEVESDINRLSRLRRNNHLIQDLSQEFLPVALMSPPQWLQLSDKDMRRIYDELTTERSSSSLSTSVGALEDHSSHDPAPTANFTPKSTTNFTFGELRFQNWKAINYLLWLSEKNDKEYDAAVDSAIAAGERPPRRNSVLSKAELAEMRPLALNGASLDSSKTPSKEVVSQAKEEIKRLRRE